MSIVWEDPPESRGRGSRTAWKAEAAMLRRAPGKWARVSEKTGKDAYGAAQTLAYNIRRGKLRAFQPAGDFEARASGGVVWVRFVGES
jgi:hypothetical protein